MDQSEIDEKLKTVKEYKGELVKSKDWLFGFLMVWTIVMMLFQVLEFFDITKTPHNFAIAYLVLLGAYVGHKEINRWANLPMKVMPGEVFVFIWWALLLMMLITSAFMHKFILPDQIFAICFEVMGAFLVAEASKAIHNLRCIAVCIVDNNHKDK